MGSAETRVYIQPAFQANRLYRLWVRGIVRVLPLGGMWHCQSGILIGSWLSPFIKGLTLYCQAILGRGGGVFVEVVIGRLVSLGWVK